MNSRRRSVSLDLGMKSLAPIRTARLTLRPLRDEDRQAVVRILSCSTTMQWVRGGPLTADAADAWLDRRIADEAERGYSMWGVEHLGHLVGFCGFFPTTEGALDLAYVIHHEHQNRGFASEAAIAAVNSTRSAGVGVLATIRPENLASMRVSEKAGLHRTGERLEAKPEMVVFRLPD